MSDLWLGWLAALILIVSSWLMGRKWRHAFLLGVLGNVLYTWESWKIGRPDMVFVCVVFALIAARNWWKWGKSE